MFLIVKKNTIIFTIIGIFCIVVVGIVFLTNSINEIKVTNSVDYNETYNEELLPGEAIEVSNIEDELLIAKNNREYNRSKATEALRMVIDDKSSSSDARKKAEDAILNLASEVDKELKIETLLLTKGYKDSVAFVSDDKTTLTIKTQKLEKKDMAKIIDIIYGITGNNIIKIVEVK